MAIYSSLSASSRGGRGAIPSGAAAACRKDRLALRKMARVYSRPDGGGRGYTACRSPCRGSHSRAARPLSSRWPAGAWAPLLH
eukprot:scaffold19271_cov28-Tisochrysis_lutea.AAC.14